MATQIFKIKEMSRHWEPAHHTHMTTEATTTAHWQITYYISIVVTYIVRLVAYGQMFRLSSSWSLLQISHAAYITLQLDVCIHTLRKPIGATEFHSGTSILDCPLTLFSTLVCTSISFLHSRLHFHSRMIELLFHLNFQIAEMNA